MKILREQKEKSYMTIGDVKKYILDYFNGIPNDYVVEFDNYEPEYGDFVRIEKHGYLDLSAIATHKLYSTEILEMLKFIKQYEPRIKEEFGWNLNKIFKDSGFEYDETKPLYDQFRDSVKIDDGYFINSFVDRIVTRVKINNRKR